MKFNKEHKVRIDTMNLDEARAFVIFLDTEIIRHIEDIKEAKKLKDRVKEKFNL